MNDYALTALAFMATGVTLWLCTKRDVKVREQWRQPVFPIVRLAVVFIAFHALCLMSGIPIWKGYIFLLSWTFVSFTGIFFGPAAALLWVTSWIFYQWVFWFPARDEVVLSSSVVSGSTVSKSISLDGRIGEVISDLAPTGKVSIDGETREARASLGFIPKGELIEVESSGAFELVVRQKQEANQSPQTRATSGPV